MTSRADGVQSRSDHVGDAALTPLARLRRAVVRRAPVAREAYQAVRRPRVQVELWRDQWRWRSEVSELRALPAPSADAPVALSISTSDQPFDVKLRVLATAGLRAAGWRVVVLTRDNRSTRLHRLYRLAGITDFVYLDDVAIGPAEYRASMTAIEQFHAAPWTFDAVRQWRFGSSWIGPQVLSSVSRRLLEGMPDPTDPDVRADIETLLPQIIGTAQRAQVIVDQLQPGLAVLDEYNYSLAGPITDTMTESGREVITLRPMFQPNSVMPMRLTAESRRLHHATVSRRTLDALDATPWTPAHEAALREEFERRYSSTANDAILEFQAAGAQRQDRGGIARSVDLSGERPLAVIFSHVLWDANLFYGEDLFDNFGHWLAETVRAAVENDGAEWIIKLHPANLSKAKFHGSSRLNEIEIIEREVGSLPDHVRLMRPDCPVSTMSIYEHADIALTVRGTPGLEMPCFGKPALTAGTGRFEGMGFTVDSSTRGEYLDRLAHIHELGPLDAAATQRAKWHAYALFRLREWNLRPFEIRRAAQQSGSWHPLETNLVRNSPASLVAGVDLLALTDWITSTSATDFTVDDPLR